MFRTIPILSISLIILLILGGVLLWWPKYQEFSDLRSEFTRKEKEIVRKEKYFSQLETLSKKLEEYPEELSKIDSALSLDPSIPALFNFFQKTSFESGLILQGLSLGKTSFSRELGGIQGISFSASVSGSYPAFKNFLSAIYKNSRIIEVESIGFSFPEEEDLFSFGLKLGTHFYQKLRPVEEIEQK